MPSALAEAQSKCVFFYLLTEMFLIDFTIGLMPTFPKNDRFDFNVNSLLKTLDIKLMENQFTKCFWQIKKDTFAGSFGFVGRKMAFTIGKSTTLIKPFFYLQKQCKHY